METSKIVPLLLAAALGGVAIGAVTTTWFWKEKLKAVAHKPPHSAEKPPAKAKATPAQLKLPAGTKKGKGVVGLPKLDVHPIGFVKSVYASRNFTPNQPTRVPNSRARITLLDRSTGSLDELEKFSHVWVVFHFHGHTGSRSKVKVLPPRKPDQVKVGVFSCRSPNRPNPIGLSLCRLDEVDKEKFHLYISGHDLLEGTPVLDLKPYIPAHDQPPNGPVRVPDWIAISSNLEPDFSVVEIDSAVREKLETMDLSSSLFRDADDLIEFLLQVLQWDGRKRHIRKEHEVNGSGQWIFEVNPKLDFVLSFPHPGLVRCESVHRKGTVKIENGQVVYL